MLVFGKDWAFSPLRKEVRFVIFDKVIDVRTYVDQRQLTATGLGGNVSSEDDTETGIVNRMDRA
jgi:hypothetical protein